MTVWHQPPAAPTFARNCLQEDTNGARHRNWPALLFTGAALADDWKEYENRNADTKLRRQRLLAALGVFWLTRRRHDRLNEL